MCLNQPGVIAYGAHLLLRNMTEWGIMSVYLYACMLICLYVYSVYMYGGVCKYAHYVKVICHMYAVPATGGPGTGSPRPVCTGIYCVCISYVALHREYMVTHWWHCGLAGCCAPLVFEMYNIFLVQRVWWRLDILHIFGEISRNHYVVSKYY